ncbi:MAG: dienelactone hydrolase family protein [Candidatus Eisenbacteria bacterium]
MNETKWAEFPGQIDFCAGERQRDDLKFVRTMLTELQGRFSIDSERVYAVGFSNGGKFAARCAVELSDRFAATVSSGGGGALPSDTTLTPVGMLPVMLEFGTRDNKLLTRLGVPGPLPMGFSKLFTTYPGLYGSIVQPFVDAFAQDPVNFTVTGDSTSYLIANFHGLSNDPKNVFKLVEVRGLEHEYPNGVNHELNGAQLHWAWMKAFSR